MSRPSRPWLHFIRKVSWCCLSFGFLLAFTPGLAHAFTNSIGVGPGTLSWTVTTSTNQCSQSSYFTEYQFSGFSFTAGGSTQSLSGGAAYFQSSCSSPPTGPQPSSLTLSGSNFTITFYPQSGGGGSATYQADQTYTVYPAYKVLNITYVPPGNQSNVSYSTDVSQGTTSTIGNSFAQGTTVDYSVSVGFAFWKSTWDFNYGTSTTNGSSTTFTETIDSTTQATYLSPSDPLSHTSDRVSLWLNPAVTLIANGGSTFSYSIAPKDTGADGSPVMNTCSVTVGQLQNPTQLTVGQLVSQTIDGVTMPGLLSLCKSAVPDNQCTTALANSNGCGCAASDFTDIVQQDPFFHSGVPQNATAAQVNGAIPNRLVWVRTDLLSPNTKDSIKISDSSSSGYTYSTVNKDTVGWTKGWSINLPLIFSAKWTDTKTLTWTDTMTSGPTYGVSHTQNAVYATNNANCYEYVDIYEDTVYHSFVFFEDSPGACPAP
jgi:hypothetical protein